MFFLLLLVGATVALPLQSQPEGQDNIWDDIIQAALSVSTVIAKREFQANLCDIVKAIQTAQDLQYIGLPLNKREVLEDFCDDPFKAAFNDQIQYIGLPLEKREGQDNIWDDIIQAALSVSTVIAKREALDWSTVDINELLQIVGGGAPLITTLLEPARKRQLQIVDWNSIDWDAINAILNQPDVPIINAFLEKRQLIWNPLEPITDPIPPFILPAKKDNMSATPVHDNIDDVFSFALTMRPSLHYDNLFDLLVDAIGVLAPVISAGKRNCLGSCNDGLPEIPEITAPLIVNDILVGRRNVEDNLWDDILQWAAEIAPIVNGPILGKRLLDVDYNPNILNPIEIVDPAITAFFKSLINTRDTFDEETFFEKYLHEIGYPVLPEGLIIVKKEA